MKVKVCNKELFHIFETGLENCTNHRFIFNITEWAGLKDLRTESKQQPNSRRILPQGYGISVSHVVKLL